MNVKPYIDSIPHIRKLIQYSRKENIELYLIGGMLRDIYLKRQELTKDFDFAVMNHARKAASGFASRTGGTFIVLDKETESYRVVVKVRKEQYIYDFTNLNQCAFSWNLETFPYPGSPVSDTKILAQGRMKGPDIPAHKKGDLSLNLSADAWKKAEALLLTAFNPQGKELFSWSLAALFKGCSCSHT